MNDYIEKAQRVLTFASAAILLPGGATVIAYAIHYDFFPYLIATLPITRIGFISVVVSVMFLLGIVMGIAASFWIVWLIVRIRRIKRHILIPIDRLTRLSLVSVSITTFLVIFYGCIFAIQNNNFESTILLCYLYLQVF